MRGQRVAGQFAAVDELLTGQENFQLMADLERLSSGWAAYFRFGNSAARFEKIRCQPSGMP
jgi:hypothetical protein